MAVAEAGIKGLGDLISVTALNSNLRLLEIPVFRVCTETLQGELPDTVIRPSLAVPEVPGHPSQSSRRKAPVGGWALPA